MPVERYIESRFMVHGEEPPGFDGKTDQFDSKIVHVTDSPGTEKQQKHLLIYPTTKAGREFCSQKAEETEAARKNFTNLMGI